MRTKSVPQVKIFHFSKVIYELLQSFFPKYGTKLPSCNTISYITLSRNVNFGCFIVWGKTRYLGRYESLVWKQWSSSSISVGDGLNGMCTKTSIQKGWKTLTCDNFQINAPFSLISLHLNISYQYDLNNTLIDHIWNSSSGDTLISFYKHSVCFFSKGKLCLRQSVSRRVKYA